MNWELSTTLIAKTKSAFRRLLHPIRESAIKREGKKKEKGKKIRKRNKHETYRKRDKDIGKRKEEKTNIKMFVMTDAVWETSSAFQRLIAAKSFTTTAGCVLMPTFSSLSTDTSLNHNTLYLDGHISLRFFQLSFQEQRRWYFVYCSCQYSSQMLASFHSP